MGENIHQKSIVRELVMIFIMILWAVSSALALYFYISQREEGLYRQLNDKTICAGRVYLELDEMEMNASAYARTMDEVYLQAYYESSGRLRERLVELKKISGDYQTVMNDARRIESFNEYQLKLWEEAGDKEIFSILNYVRGSLPVQKIQAQNMIVENSDLALEDCLRQTDILKRIKFASWILIIFLLGGCSALMIGRMNKIMAALRKNREIAKALADHKWDAPDVPLGYYSELDELSLAMNQMKHEIIEYIGQLRQKSRLEQQLAQERLKGEKKEKALIEARLAALRAQVNPHFLFNALNLIGKTAFLEEPELAMELVEAVSKILRYALDQSGHMVVLSMEMEIVRSYIFLQQSRFGPNLHFVCRIPPEAEHIRIPSMIVQPIVENSFKHGFKDKNEMTVTILAKLMEECLCLTMEDDGSGFDLSILEERGMGIGVRNVQQRLELVYQGKAEFKIESRVGSYTRVTVKIPRGGKE